MSTICIGIAQYSCMSLKKPQFEVNIKNKMRPVDVKALPIIAFALTGRIVLLGLIVRRTGVRRSAYYKIGVI